MIEMISFYGVAFLILLAMLYIIISRDIFRSILSMLVVFLLTGVMYFIMDMPFLGVFQIIIYTGAMMILFVTAINVIGKVNDKKDKFPYINIIAVLSVCGFFAIFALALCSLVAYSPLEFTRQIVSFKDVAIAFFTTYSFQLILSSLLLFVAVVVVYNFLRSDDNEI